MGRFVLSFLLIGLLGMFLLGCGSDDAGTERAYCEKLQKCNYMQAGQTVDTCSESIQKAWNLLTSGAKTDCVNATNKCVNMADCTNFANCIQTLPNNC